MFKFVSRDATRDVCGGVELGQFAFGVPFATFLFRSSLLAQPVSSPTCGLPSDSREGKLASNWSTYRSEQV